MRSEARVPMRSMVTLATCREPGRPPPANANKLHKRERSVACAMMHFFSLKVHHVAWFIVVLVMSSCNQKGADGNTAPVVWPELNTFDELAYRADGVARTGDSDALKELLPALVEAGKSVSVDTVPSNTAAPTQVENILGDLNGLVDALSVQSLEDDALFDLVLGLHPVIENLIEAAGMPHLHGNEGPHDGFLHAVFDAEGKQTGTVEVKLHDDAGDVEVWLTRGGHGGAPWRLPLDSTLELEFPDLDKKVTLAVRDREANRDESGASTIHEGTTSYFVFPGESGADPEWLMGKDFAAKAELRFTGATTGPFVLRPHVHD